MHSSADSLSFAHFTHTFRETSGDSAVPACLQRTGLDVAFGDKTVQTGRGPRYRVQVGGFQLRSVNMIDLPFTKRASTLVSLLADLQLEPAPPARWTRSTGHSAVERSREHRYFVAMVARGSTPRMTLILRHALTA